MFRKEDPPRFCSIKNAYYVGAMANPGGGKNDIPNRLKRHFFCINMTMPSQVTVENIFGTLIAHKYNEN